MNIERSAEDLTVHLDWQTTRDDNDFSDEETAQLSKSIGDLFTALGMTQGNVEVKVRD